MHNCISEEELDALFAKEDDSLLMASDRIAQTLKSLYVEMRKPVAGEWVDLGGGEAIRYSSQGMELASVEGPNGWFMVRDGEISHHGVETGIEGRIAADTYLSDTYHLLGVRFCDSV